MEKVKVKFDHKEITWGEFKEKIEVSGLSDSDLLRYIDVNFPVYTEKGEEFIVLIHLWSDGSIRITNE